MLKLGQARPPHAGERVARTDRAALPGFGQEGRRSPSQLPSARKGISVEILLTHLLSQFASGLGGRGPRLPSDLLSVKFTAGSLCCLSLLFLGVAFSERPSWLSVSTGAGSRV